MPLGRSRQAPRPACLLAMHGSQASIHDHLALALALALGHLVGRPVQPLKKNAIKVALNGVFAGSTFLRLREHETQISRYESADVGRHQRDVRCTRTEPLRQGRGILIDRRGGNPAAPPCVSAAIGCRRSSTNRAYPPTWQGRGPGFAHS